MSLYIQYYNIFKSNGIVVHSHMHSPIRTMRVTNIVNPEIAKFVRHLIVALNISNIVWLYTNDSGLHVDSLIKVANVSLCQAHNLQNPYTSVADLVTELPIGPHYVLVFTVMTWQTVETHLIQDVRNAMRYRAICTYVIIFVDGQIPPVFQLWISPDVFERMISVRFPCNCTANEALITNQGQSNVGDGSTLTVADFIENRSLLAAMMMTASDTVYTDTELRVTISPSTPNCITMSMSTERDGAVLFGRDVAMYRLIAERTRTNLRITLKKPLFGARDDGFEVQRFALNVIGRPLWLSPFIAESSIVVHG